MIKLLDATSMFTLIESKTEMYATCNFSIALPTVQALHRAEQGKVHIYAVIEQTTCTCINIHLVNVNYCHNKHFH